MEYHLRLNDFLTSVNNAAEGREEQQMLEKYSKQQKYINLHVGQGILKIFYCVNCVRTKAYHN